MPPPLEERPCACGCGAIIPLAKLRAHPTQRFASKACGLRFRRTQPEFEAHRRQRQRQAMALDRLDRWGQPAYDKVHRILERRGDPLTRQQAAVLKVALAEVIRTAYRRGYRAGQFKAPTVGRRRRVAAAESPPLATD